MKTFMVSFTVEQTYHIAVQAETREEVSKWLEEMTTAKVVNDFYADNYSMIDVDVHDAQDDEEPEFTVKDGEIVEEIELG